MLFEHHLRQKLGAVMVKQKRLFKIPNKYRVCTCDQIIMKYCWCKIVICANSNVVHIWSLIYYIIETIKDKLYPNKMVKRKMLLLNIECS